MKCSNPEIGKLITRYEFNLLSEEERITFENHLLECNACFDDLKSMSKIVLTMKKYPDKFIDVLEKQSISPSRSMINKIKMFFPNVIYDIFNIMAPKLKGHRALIVSVAISIFLLIGSLIIWNMFLSKNDNKPAIVTENKKDTTVSIPLKIPDRKYRDLAVIERAPYILLRGQEPKSESDLLFYEGMRFYNDSKYLSAIKKLLLTSRKNPDNIEAKFYLGICYLLVDSSDKAIKYLSQVISSEDPSLLEKSHWYLGNAFLLNNDAEKALEEMKKVIRSKGDLEERALSLLTKINKIKDVDKINK